ncbi:CBS domain-containing protein [Aestuariivivens sediminis]|uniref:CBS domain-containing protein n=1 Tax=Aestuariivivens sediminis TaxID=2913557 RepID=UPI001F57168D|nr:CBS domain-containing protein [Aestuariivivens sediminis]
MKALIPVSEIMTKHIIALDRTDDLTRAEALFKQHHIRHIPVVQEESIIGMLSYSDLLKISLADATNDDRDVDTVVYNVFTVEQVMSKNLVTVSSSTSIKEVAKILSVREFHALPVVDDSILVGIVTTTDLIKYMLKEL